MKRTTRLVVLVTPIEAAAIRSLAEAERRTVSDYLRCRALPAEVDDVA